MAEELDNKTEVPTPLRRKEARERGVVARSENLTAAVLAAGAGLLLYSFGPPLFAAMRAAVEQMLGPESLAAVGPGSAAEPSVQALAVVARAAAPLLVGVLVLAVAVNAAQVGFVFVGKRPRPEG